MKRTMFVAICLFFTFSLYGEGEKTEMEKDNVVKLGNPAHPDAPKMEIEVSAKKYEFAPSTIEVAVNTRLIIHLKSTDKEHGLELKAFKGKCVKAKPGTDATIEFYVEKAGEYEFQCCKFCGMGHGKMKGKIVAK